MANYPELPFKIVTNKTSLSDDINALPSALHEDIEIKCFYEGTSTLLVGTQTITVKTGDVVVINPYEFHATVDCKNESQKGKYHLFMIPLDSFTQGCNELDLRNLFFTQKKIFKNLLSQDKEIFELLLSVANEYEEKKEAYSVAVKALLMHVFVLLLRKGISDDKSHSLQSDTLRSYKLIEPALTHIRDNFADCISVDILADLCQVSKHYFCRTFKAVMGKTAMEYLRNYRLTISNTLLLNTDENISQIAEHCGFESANYFCRCYKSFYGVSPGKNRSKVNF